ncbi:MAG: hypothetical protein ACYTKC_15735, partial [Planctomycetota bacterium]
ALTLSLYGEGEERGGEQGAERREEGEKKGEPGPAGRLVMREHRIYGHTDGSVVNTLALLPGRYRLVVKNLAGEQAETRFEVQAGGEIKTVDVRFP